MLVKKTKQHRLYLLKLKNEVSSFIVNFKKRYQLFPWTKVNKLKKFKLSPSTTITVNGTEFTALELVKEINKTKVRLQSKLKPSFYNYILRAYIKESMNKTGSDLTAVYNIYKEQLELRFKEANTDLMFCLESLKELNKAYKTNSKVVKESANDTQNIKPLYFYHLAQNNIVGDELLSPFAMLEKNMKDLAYLSTNKYRDRLVNGWDIYPGKNPKDLTIEEVLNGLNQYRGSNGSKMIYFFRYPPYKELGKNMTKSLSGKTLYRININDPNVKKYIEEIFWGYKSSHSDNSVLNRKYYEDITPDKYFSKYDDNSYPLFGTLNHIGISFQNGSIPLKLLEKVDMDLNDVVNFNYKTNKMEYIITKNGRHIIDIKASDFLNHYVSLTPNEFVKYGGGVCWDYVPYEAKYFKSNKIKYDTFYVCLVDDNTNPTHTFLLFYLNNKCYWFESSWKNRAGIYEFDSRDEALSYIIDEMIKEAPDKTKIRDKFVVKYDALKPELFGISCIAYMEYMANKPEFSFTKRNNVKPKVIVHQELDERGNVVLTEACKDVYSDKYQIATESNTTLDNNYESKGKKKLSSFKKVRITESVIEKYKKEYPFLKHVRCKDTNEYICDGYIWFDNDKLVANVGSCEYTDDKTKWIVSLDVAKEYQGYGLSKQILDYAVNDMNCKYLSVNKNNKIAKKVYDDYGFKVYQDDKTMYYMTIDKNHNTPVVEACKDVATARKLCSEVKNLAKKYDANFYFVTDGASVTSNKGNQAVKTARQAVAKWEREHGFDDVEDWTDNPDDFSNYRLKSDKPTSKVLTESENSRILYTYHKALNGKYVYHGTAVNIQTPYLTPMGVDLGNKLEPPGWSLYTWVDEWKAVNFAMFSCIYEVCKRHGLKPKIVTPRSCEMVTTREEMNKLLDMVDRIPNRDKKFYVYKLKITPDMEIGLGHASFTSRCVTIKSPDKIPYVEKCSYFLNKNDLISRIQIVEQEEFESYLHDFRKIGINTRKSSVLMDKDIIYNGRISSEIKKGLRNNELTPADDITSFLDKKGLSLEPIPFRKRLLNKPIYEVNKEINSYGEKLFLLTVNESVKENNIIESEDIEMRDTFVNEHNEVVDTNDFLLECALSIIESDDEDSMELATEGANLDIRRDYKAIKKRFKKNMKDIKKSIKKKNYDNAKELIDQTISDIKDTRTIIKSTEGDIGSFVFGLYTCDLIIFWRTIALSLIPFIGIPAASVWACVDELKHPVSKAVNKGIKNMTLDDFNLYKNVSISNLDRMITILDNAKKKIKTMENVDEKAEQEKEKKTAVAKESAKLAPIKKALYESCNRGEITIQEREELLKKFRDKYYITEKTDIAVNESGVSRKEKFDKVRTILYERCNNGELTVEERENLIYKAKEMIFAENEDNGQLEENKANDTSKETDKATKELTKEMDKVIK